MTATSTPSWTLTSTFTARVLGEAIGEDAHAMQDVELYRHQHGGVWINSGGTANPSGTDTSNLGNFSFFGGINAMNIIQGTAYLNAMVKLQGRL